MKKVAMFVTNPCTHDARVMKEAKSLSNAGYDVRVFALSNALNDPGLFEQDGYFIHRLKTRNIFVRARESLWGMIAKVLSSIKWVLLLPFKIVRLAVIFVVGIIVSATYRLVSLLPTPNFKPISRIWRSLRSRVHKLTIINKSQADSVVEYASNYRALRLLMRFSYKAIRKLFFLFRRLFFKIRRLFYLSRRFYYRSRKYLLIHRKIFRLMRLFVASCRRSYRRARSWFFKFSSKIIYKTLMPFHKISTYYYFCRAAGVQAIKWNADYAHAHDLNTMYAAKLVKDSVGAKVVYDSHELWVHRNRVGRNVFFEQFMDRYFEKKLISYADRVITVCESIAVWLKNEYPKSEKAEVIRNLPYMIDSDSSGIYKKNVKQRLDIPENDLLIMYTGKFTTGRGIEIGLEVISELPNAHMALLGYGEPNYVEEITSISTSLGISSKVHFCDPIPYTQVPSFITGADFALVFIEPICLSYEYALPNKLFESIQAEIPIIGSSLVEIKRVVEGLDVGLCFNSKSDLVDRLKNVDAKQVAHYAKNIRKHKSNLHWAAEEAKLLNLYLELD